MNTTTATNFVDEGSCAVYGEKMVPRRVRKLGPFHRLQKTKFKSNKLFQNEVLKNG